MVMQMGERERSAMVRVRAVVRGRVQGVGYRAYTRRIARDKQLVGGVRNLDDGSVEVEAEGPKATLINLLELLRIGPPGAHVRTVDADWGLPLGRSCTFEIWY